MSAFRFDQFVCFPSSPTKPISAVLGGNKIPEYPLLFADLPAGLDPQFPPASYIVKTPPPVVSHHSDSEVKQLVIESPQIPLRTKKPRRRALRRRTLSHKISSRTKIQSPSLPRVTSMTSFRSKKFDSPLSPKLQKTKRRRSATRSPRKKRNSSIRNEENIFESFTAITEGVLYRRRHKANTWHKGFAKLFPGYLEYYKTISNHSKDEANPECYRRPLIVIKLSQYVMTSEMENEDKIMVLQHRKKERRYYFKGDGDFEWFEGIESQIYPPEESAPKEVVASVSESRLTRRRFHSLSNLTSLSRSRIRRRSVGDRMVSGPSSVDNIIISDVVQAEKLPPGHVFGLTLQELEEDQISEQLHIPKIVEQTISYLEDHVKQKGLFRVSGRSVEIVELRKKFDSGEFCDLSSIQDPHVVTGLLKKFLRDLREPLLTFDLYDEWIAVPEMEEEQQLESVHSLYTRLPPLNKSTWTFILEFITRICFHFKYSMMTPESMGIVIGPTVLWRKSVIRDVNEFKRESKAVSYLVKFFIEHKDDIVHSSLIEDPTTPIFSSAIVKSGSDETESVQL